MSRPARLPLETLAPYLLDVPHHLLAEVGVVVVEDEGERRVDREGGERAGVRVRDAAREGGPKEQDAGDDGSAVHGPSSAQRGG